MAQTTPSVEESSVPAGEAAVHCRVPLVVRSGGQKAPVTALLDTGNLLPGGLAISKRFAAKNKFNVKKAASVIGTARKGANMDVVGTVADVTLEIGGKQLVSGLTATVIDQLSTAVNVGAAVLKQAAANLEFRPTGAVLAWGQSSSVPLIQQVEPAAAETRLVAEGNSPGSAVADTMPELRRSYAAVLKNENIMPPQKPAEAEMNSSVTLEAAGAAVDGSVDNRQKPAVAGKPKGRPDLVGQKPAGCEEAQPSTAAVVSRAGPVAITGQASSVTTTAVPEQRAAEDDETRRSSPAANPQSRSSAPVLSNSTIKRSKLKNVVSNRLLKKHCIRIARRPGPTKTKFFTPHRTRLGSSVKISRISPVSSVPKVGEVMEFGKDMELTAELAAEVENEHMCIMSFALTEPMESGQKLLVAEQELNSGVVVVPGVYKTAGRSVKIAVLNHGDHTVSVPERVSVRASKLEMVECDKAEMEKHLWEELAVSEPAAIQSLSTKTTAGEGEERSFKTILEELRLDESVLLRKNPQIKKKLVAELHRLRRVFADEEQPVGLTDLVEADIKLKRGARPVRQKDRPINPHLEADLNRQLTSWLKDGIVEPSKSPWSSPLVPVRKKTGEIRWAVDLRQVNRVVVADSFPLPRIEGLLERAGGHRIYSTLDASSAYHTIKVRPEDREILAFSTPGGLYQYCRLPFGLATAPAIYSRFIKMVLNKLGPKNIVIYLDDVLVFADRMTTHLERLVEVLEEHLAAGIKVKASKTRLFQEEVVYLGHKLSAEGISMVPSYVEKIKQWPAPKTAKQVRTLVGFFAYYRQFIPTFAELMAPINSLKATAKGTAVEWTEECQANLDRL